MGEAPKARIAKLRRQFVIPRHRYLEAVKRQKDRAWAKSRDPATDIFAWTRPPAVIEQSSSEEGTDPKIYSNLPKVRDPDPALFDSEEEIQRDDKLIGVYLSDNPTEKRKPMARGHTHEELLEYWKNSRDGRRYFEWRKKIITEAIEEVSAKYLGDVTDA